MGAPSPHVVCGEEPHTLVLTHPHTQTRTDAHTDTHTGSSCHTAEKPSITRVQRARLGLGGAALGPAPRTSLRRGSRQGSRALSSDIPAPEVVVASGVSGWCPGHEPASE